MKSLKVRWTFGAVAIVALSGTVWAAVDGNVVTAAAGEPAASTPQMAQQPNSEGTAGLQEIVITAEKREENLDKVPISVVVFDQAMMEERGIQNITDLVNNTPGVDYWAYGAPTNSLSVRGITSNDVGFSTVGMYIDDTPLMIRGSQTGGLQGFTRPLVFDLDRVEVLRGPQGTLFGAGAEGGILRFITPQPSLTEYSGYTRAGIGITDVGGPSYEAGAAAGGPIVQDELGFRVSVWHRRDGGYIDQVSAVPGGTRYDNANYNNSDVVRAALALAPTTALKITASFNYQDTYSNNISNFEPAGSRAYDDTFTQQLGGTGPQYSNVGDGRFVNPGLLLEPESDRFYLPALKVELNLPSVQVVSSTSYTYRSDSSFQDYTDVLYGAFGLPWSQTASNWALTNLASAQNIATEELRLQSTDSSRPLQWTVGAFYAKARQQTILDLRTDEPIVAEFVGPLLPGDVAGFVDERDADTQVAAFGQLTYQLFKHVSLTAGVRVARESDAYSLFRIGPLSAGPFFAGELSQTVIDPKYGINVQLDDNNLLYASAAKGDRIGGVNPPIEFAGAVCAGAQQQSGYSPTFQGDSLWSYEVGTKNRLFDGRMQIEGSAFYINWSDIQQNVVLQSCSFQGFIANLGKAISDGFDLSINTLVGQNLKLGLSVAYTNAKDSSTLNIDDLQVVTKGEQISAYNTPWTVVPTAEYYFTFAHGYHGYLRLDDEFHSRNPGPFAQQEPSNVSFNAAFIPNPSTNVTNMHVGATWGRWDVSFYALNMLNSHPILGNSAFQSTQVPLGAYTLRPLTIGVQSVYRW
jgi:outer membrane receptor protein involved in Fe transport